MKKRIFIIMAIRLLLSLTACGVDKSRIADNEISE